MGKLHHPPCVNDTHSLFQSANQLNNRKIYIIIEKGPDGLAGFWCGATYPAGWGQSHSTQDKALNAPGAGMGRDLICQGSRALPGSFTVERGCLGDLRVYALKFKLI